MSSKTKPATADTNVAVNLFVFYSKRGERKVSVSRGADRIWKNHFIVNCTLPQMLDFVLKGFNNHTEVWYYKIEEKPHEYVFFVNAGEHNASIPLDTTNDASVAEYLKRAQECEIYFSESAAKRLSLGDALGVFKQFGLPPFVSDFVQCFTRQQTDGIKVFKARSDPNGVYTNTPDESSPVIVLDDDDATEDEEEDSGPPPTKRLKEAADDGITIRPERFKDTSGGAKPPALKTRMDAEDDAYKSSFGMRMKLPERSKPTGVESAPKTRIPIMTPTDRPSMARTRREVADDAWHAKKSIPIMTPPDRSEEPFIDISRWADSDRATLARIAAKDKNLAEEKAMNEALRNGSLNPHPPTTKLTQLMDDLMNPLTPAQRHVVTVANSMTYLSAVHHLEKSGLSYKLFLGYDMSKAPITKGL